jgi:Enoyl-(Acyl carrier protein) reductase
LSRAAKVSVFLSGDARRPRLLAGITVCSGGFVDVLVHAAATFEQGALSEIDLDTVWKPPSPQLLAYVTSKAALIGLTPDDVAATVAFLCTDGAEAITGQTVSVDGGLVFR